MLGYAVQAAVRFSRLVVAAAIGVLAVGVYQVHAASVDIYPEFDAPAVQIQAEALGLSAQEVEQLITVPLEQDLLNGIPWVEHISSTSMPGLSAIDLHFEPGTDLQAARQMTQERMTQAKALPNVGTPPIMVQPTSSTGRVAMVSMHSSTVSTMQMSVLARWQIRPRLMSVPGVANVSIWGLRDRQLQVQVDPARLRAKSVTLTELIESAGNALWVSPLSFVEASSPGTGGFVETPNQRLGVQHVQPISTSDQLSNVAVEGDRPSGLRIGDVATVTENYPNLIGDASLDGAPGLMLVVERFPEANTAQVTADVDAALEAMAPGLSGIDLHAQVFRPATYLQTALRHLGVAGLVGAGLVLCLLGVLLSSWRAVLVPLVAVPLSVVSALWVLHLRGETLTSITVLGVAAASALIVDDAIGDVMAIRARRAAVPDGHGLLSTVVEVVAARRVPLLIAAVIAGLVLVPAAIIGDVVGAFSGPLTFSFLLAVGASLMVAVLVTPALSVLILRDPAAGDSGGRTDRWLRRGADRVAPLIGRPRWVAIGAAVLAAGAILVAALAPNGPMLPTLQDRNVLVRVQGAPGTSLSEMGRIVGALAAELRSSPGVASAGAHVGRAINADEIVGVNSGEIWIGIDPDADYASALSRVHEIAGGYPGLRTRVSSYAEDRVAAATVATPQDLVVRVSGPEFATLEATAENVSQVLRTVPGVLAPQVQSQVREPTVEIEVDLVAAQRHGLRPGDVRREASTLISGLTVGSLYEEQKVYDVVVWGGPANRQSLSDLRDLVIDAPNGGHVKLGDVAAIRMAANPVSIAHQNVSRSLDVTASVNGRSAADVAAEVTSRLRGLSLPYEYRAEVLPAAADREARHLQVAAVAGAVALLSFLLLQAATGSWRLAGALIAIAPLSVTGGLLIAPAAGGVRSIGVLAALMALFALGLRQALVFVRLARDRSREPGAVPIDAVRAVHRETAPSVVGSLLVTAGILVGPAILGGVAGLEILHPFAVTMLVGLLTVGAVSLIAVPAATASLLSRHHTPDPAQPDPAQPDPPADGSAATSMKAEVTP